MVRLEVQDYCYSSFKKMFTDYLEDKQAEQMNIRHEGVICDGCNKNPITGIRYMCSVRSDTDFCQDCERSGAAGQYPLLKIRKPTHAPAKMICQYNR
jgi:next-to-BRCA1 protein 1